MPSVGEPWNCTSSGCVPMPSMFVLAHRAVAEQRGSSAVGPSTPISHSVARPPTGVPVAGDTRTSVALSVTVVPSNGVLAHRQRDVDGRLRDDHTHGFDAAHVRMTGVVADLEVVAPAASLLVSECGTARRGRPGSEQRRTVVEADRGVGAPDVAGDGDRLTDDRIRRRDRRDCTDGVDGRHDVVGRQPVASPNWVAITTHEPVAVTVTTPALIAQAPLAAIETGKPDVAVAATGNDEPVTAVAGGEVVHPIVCGSFATGSSRARWLYASAT